MKTNRFLLAALLPALLLSGVAVAQDVPLDVELGYRWTDVTGNEEMFRNQVNEREGLQLRALSFGLGDIRGTNVIDHFRIDAADLGIGPNGMLRLEAGRTGYWKLNAAYRHSEHYSNYPTIANPFLEKGVLDSQHRFDRSRDSVDVDLELLPGKAVRPLLGYSYSKYSGPGLTTYHVGPGRVRAEPRPERQGNRVPPRRRVRRRAGLGPGPPGLAAVPGQGDVVPGPGRGRRQLPRHDPGRSRDPLVADAHVDDRRRHAGHHRGGHRQARLRGSPHGHLRPGQLGGRGRPEGEPLGEPGLLRDPAVLHDPRGDLLGHLRGALLAGRHPRRPAHRLGLRRLGGLQPPEPRARRLLARQRPLRRES